MKALRLSVCAAWVILFFPFWVDAAEKKEDQLGKVVSTNDPYKKSQLVHQVARKNIDAAFTLELLKREKADRPVALAVVTTLVNASFEADKTTHILRACMSRPYVFPRALAAAAISPNVESIVKELLASRSRGDLVLAAALLATWAEAKVRDEEGAHPSDDDDGGKKRKGGGKGGKGGKQAAGMGKLDAEPYVKQIIEKGDPASLELAALAAALLKLDAVAEALEKTSSRDQNVQGVLEYYRARTGKPIDEKRVRSLLSSSGRAPAQFAGLSPALNTYNPRGSAAIYVCRAIREAPDEKYLKQMVALLIHPDLRVQIDAAGAIGAIGKPEAAGNLLKRLKTGRVPWPAKVAFLDAIGALPAKSSIEPLIGLLAQEKGRFRQDVNYALASIAGKQYGETHDQWRLWWKKNGADFKVDPARTKAFREKYRVQDVGVPELAGYYGSKIISDHVVFVLDASNSMKGDKIASLKATMIETLESLPPFVQYNIVEFGGIIKLHKEDGLLDVAYRENITKMMADLSLTGGTRTFDAMEIGHQVPGADTIIYLSDGAPVGGHYGEWPQIQHAFDLFNRYRRIAIHTIYFAGGGGGAGAAKKGKGKKGGRAGKGGGTKAAHMALISRRNVGHLTLPGEDAGWKAPVEVAQEPVQPTPKAGGTPKKDPGIGGLLAGKKGEEKKEEKGAEEKPEKKEAEPEEEDE